MSISLGRSLLACILSKTRHNLQKFVQNNFDWLNRMIRIDTRMRSLARRAQRLRHVSCRESTNHFGTPIKKDKLTTTIRLKAQ